MRTYVAKGEEAEALKVGAQWFVLDATDKALGRLATKAARILIGKDKASFTPYLDSGDHVVVINADKIKMTGNKVEQKVYYSHSGYPGGLKEVPAKRVRESQARMDDSRSDSRHVAEEQAARAPRQEVARLSRRGRFGASRGAEAAAVSPFKSFPASPGLHDVEVSARRLFLSKWCLSREPSEREVHERARIRLVILSGF